MAFDRLYKLTEAAPLLGMRPRHLRSLVAKGTVAAVRDGNRLKFRESELQRYVEALHAYAPAPKGEPCKPQRQPRRRQGFNKPGRWV